MKREGYYMPLEDWPGDLPQPRNRTMLLNEYEDIHLGHLSLGFHFGGMAVYAIFSVTRPGQLLVYWILRW